MSLQRSFDMLSSCRRTSPDANLCTAYPGRCETTVGLHPGCDASTT